MNSRFQSLLGTLTLVAILVVSCWRGVAFGNGPVSITLQVVAGALMVWARIVFGLRSFHATAGPTAGALVTRGPYAWVRNPIYAAILLFLVGSCVAHPDALHGVLLGVAVVAVHVRVWAEERELCAGYGAEYEAYTKRVRRIVPGVY